MDHQTDKNGLIIYMKNIATDKSAITDCQSKWAMYVCTTVWKNTVVETPWALGLKAMRYPGEYAAKLPKWPCLLISSF